MNSRLGMIFVLAVAVSLLAFISSDAGNVIMKSDCVTAVVEKTVRGDSLSGFIENEEIVKILFGYYDCNEVGREDVIAYDFAGRDVPIIKIVKGIPGDEFHLKETSDGWNILINGEVVKNSQNQTYVLNENGYNMLSLYENSYDGVMPENTYIIMGNLVSGTVDSSRFGLIHKTDILGKVIT